MRIRSGLTERLVLAVGIPVLFAFTMIAFGQWTPYSHENAHIGIKFASSTHAGCGVEILNDTGQSLGLDAFYCE